MANFNVRFDQALNVSGAFDNCFFHTYLLHLFANDLDLPEDLFTFKSILGDKGPAAELQKRFPDIDSLSIFAEYAQRQSPERPPVSPNFIFEKTLVLGFLMREWFATTMAQNLTIANSLEAETIEQFKNYKEFRAFMEKDQLLSGAEGVLYAANEQFLEYFCARPKEGALTAHEKRFEQYFTDAQGNVTQALKNFWQDKGYQNYCQLIAQPSTKLSYADLGPVIEILKQPLTIYDATNRATKIKEIAGNEDTPEMETKLNVLEGHYYLLRTEQTAPLLGEYESSLKQYTKERAEVLEVEGNKLKAANAKSSLFVAAICPPGQMDQPPFNLLLKKVDEVNHFVQFHKQEEAQQKKALLKETYLKMVGQDGLAIQSIENSYIISNTADYVEILRAAIKQNPQALQHASSQQVYAILSHKGLYIPILSEAVKQNPLAIQWVNRAFVNNHPEEYEKIAIAAVQQSSEALFYVHHDYADAHFKEYKNIALIAVRHHGLSLKNIRDRIFEYKRPEDYQLYKELVLSAMQSNPEARQYINWEYLKNAPVAVRAAIIETVVKHDGLLLEKVSNLDYQYLNGVGLFARIAYDAVQQNGLALQFVTGTPLRNQAEIYEKICTAAVKQNGEALSFVHRDYIEDHIPAYQQIVYNSVQSNGLALRSINENMYKAQEPKDYELYKNIVLTAMRNHPEAHQHINWEYLKKAPVAVCAEIAQIVEKKQELPPSVIKELKEIQQRIQHEKQSVKAQEEKQRLAVEQRKAQEEKQRLADEQRKAQEEKQRLADEQRKAQEEKQRLADEQRKAQEEKQRLADEQRKAQEEKQRLADEQRKAQEEKQRLADEQRKAQEEKQRLADEQRKAQEEKQRLADEQRKAQEEKQRLADEQRKTQEEKQRLADEQRKAQEEKQRLADEQRKTQEKQRPSEEENKAQKEKQRLADEQRKAQEEKQRLADEQRKAQEKQRLAEEQRKAQEEKQRLAEEQRKAQEEKQRLADEQRKAQEKQRLADEQRKAQEKQREEEEPHRNEKEQAGKPTEPNHYHEEFNKAIHVLKDKMDEFQKEPDFATDQKLQDAYGAANALYAALEDQGNEFFTKEPSPASYKNFKDNCKRHVQEAREVLDQHRGWGRILLNVFAMIITAGIGYAIAAGVNIAVNKGKFTFFATDSSEKLSTIEDYIENKANKAAPAA
ncbi:Dot/Icm T4SS effector Ceg23 [Legionella fallonii]|uniref:Uncharacterized protein n=1 Tax=Legionella fallonii LLAP-10 TaxID=1212491 RepID=A0A098G340_9GAMM|nr:hypothetical protein [Legionella fallonii]CEG56404.1 protein of unknown function [Legionella fallonii LLAP-10]